MKEKVESTRRNIASSHTYQSIQTNTYVVGFVYVPSLFFKTFLIMLLTLYDREWIQNEIKNQRLPETMSQYKNKAKDLSNMLVQYLAQTASANVDASQVSPRCSKVKFNLSSEPT
jgi:hypothetical protein